MKRKHRQRLIKVLVLINLWLCIPVVMLWLFLRFVDPAGAYEHLHHATVLHAHRAYHPTGYTFDTGRYELNRYSVTILPDGLRLVPDSVLTSGCTIAFVGDSVTFGYAVDDDETFVNLAARHSGINTLNTAKAGYSSANVLDSIEYYDADGYVWLILSNDTEPRRGYTPSIRSHDMGVFEAYSRFFDTHYNIPDTKPMPFDNDKYLINAVHQVYERDDVLLWAYHEIVVSYLSDYGVIGVEHYTDARRISISDAHPNEDGHAFLWQQLQPHFDEFVNDRCN